MPILPLTAAIVVPQALLTLCFLVLMGLGAFVIVTSLRHPPKGGRSELKVPGLKLEVRGPAWLTLVVVGALMLMAPIVTAVIQRREVTPFPVEEPVRIVQTLNEPHYEAFQFLRDVSYLDLRQSTWQPWFSRLPFIDTVIGKHSRIRPATLLNYMEIRKVAEAADIHIQYLTSGLLDTRCLTHSYTSLAATKGSTNIADVVADISHVQVGSEFVLVTEATYWNAFSGRDGDYYATYTHNQAAPELMEIVVTFPESKPAHTVEVTETPPDSDVSKLFQGGTSIVGPDGRTYYWALTHSGQGRWLYQVNWAW